MYKKLATMLAVLGLSLILGCATLGQAQTFAENPRFLRSGPVLGLTEKELIKKIGLPVDMEEAGSCTAPVVEDEKLPSNVFSVDGHVWIYKAQENDYMAALGVCFVKGYVVGTRREFSQITDQVVYHMVENTMDLELIRRVVAGELDDSSAEDRQSPVYDGPEYEI